MDDTPDPSAQFFPDIPLEDINLYSVLNLSSKTATLSEIKAAYRKLALVHHPDKHAKASADAQKSASLKFQQVGFAYAVLSDEKRRARYDQTGRTDEGGGLFDPANGEGGWEAYFEELFDKVTRGKLDEMKKEYQGSEEEVSDLRSAYVEHKGNLESIMNEIPHSTIDDEERFISILKPLIASQELPKFTRWEKDIKDSKAREKRLKKSQSEAKQAEEHAKELGVWDEFYGSGKEGKRKTKGKGKEPAESTGSDETALQALILRRKEQRHNILDSLLAKYGGADGEQDPPSKSKSKKRSKEESEQNEETPPIKKTKKAPAPPPGKGRRTKKT